MNENYSLELGKIVFYSVVFNKLESVIINSNYYQLKLLTVVKHEEFTSRLISLLFALFTFITAIGIFLQQTLEQCINMRPIIMGYFVYDFSQCFYKFINAKEDSIFSSDRKTISSRDRKTISSSDRKTIDNEKNIIRQPNLVALHHVVTAFYIYGFLLMNSNQATLSFCLGELPIIFIQYEWLLRFFDLSHFKQYVLVKQIKLKTYFARIIFFIVFFYFNTLLNTLGEIFNLINGSKLLLLIFLWLMNLLWFIELYKKENAKFLGIILEQIFTDIKLSPYSKVQR